MAQVKMIEMDEEGDPQWITARLSLEELAYVAMVTGKQSEVTAEEVMPGGGASANAQLWEMAVGDVFNRWWDGGIDEYRRTRAR